MLILGTNPPPEHDRAYLQHAVVQILDNLGLLFEICRLPRPRLNQYTQLAVNSAKQ